MVDGLSAGSPNYEEISPAPAHAVRMQLPQLRATAACLETVRSIEFQGGVSQGWDLFNVHQENGMALYGIMLESDGKIPAALADVTDGPITLGPQWVVIQAHDSRSLRRRGSPKSIHRQSLWFRPTACAQHTLPHGLYIHFLCEVRY